MISYAVYCESGNMERNPVNIIYLVIGWVALALGAIGAFLPVLPTTPFILLAAFCFSRGSKRTHEWLVSNPLFGGMVREWEAYGTIGMRAKLIATLMIVFSFGSI